MHPLHEEQDKPGEKRGSRTLLLASPYPNTVRQTSADRCLFVVLVGTQISISLSDKGWSNSSEE